LLLGQGDPITGMKTLMGMWRVYGRYVEGMLKVYRRYIFSKLPFEY